MYVSIGQNTKNVKKTVNTTIIKVRKANPHCEPRRKRIETSENTKATRKQMKNKTENVTPKIDQNVPCPALKTKSPHKITNTMRISFENHAESAPPRPEWWNEAGEIVDQRCLAYKFASTPLDCLNAPLEEECFAPLRLKPPEPVLKITWIRAPVDPVITRFRQRKFRKTTFGA